MFQFLEIKKFLAGGATNPAENGFKFGALANLHAPTASFFCPILQRSRVLGVSQESFGCYFEPGSVPAAERHRGPESLTFFCKWFKSSIFVFHWIAVSYRSMPT